MTSAVQALGTLWIHDTALSSAMVKIGELADMKLKIDAKEIDTTNVDEYAWGSSISGAKSADISGSANLIVGDSGYVHLRDAILNGTLMYCYALASGTPSVTPVGFMMACRVLSGNFTLASPNSQQKIDFTIKNSGALAVASVVT